ncbi:MAG: hypothetical protein ACKOOG_06825, partial [Actinomycetota bacterium]
DSDHRPGVAVVPGIVLGEDPRLEKGPHPCAEGVPFEAIEQLTQLRVEHDPDRHYFALLEERGEDLRRMAAFDIVVNNADRKGGHCLEAATDGRIFGIDHGLCFHAQWKLRTVIWDFGGEPVPPAVTDDLARLAEELATGGLDADLGGLLDRFEHDALGARVRALLASGIFPEPDPGHHCYPWPMI